MNAAATVTPIERVLLVGYGYAGRRFAAAIDHLSMKGLPIKLVGLCDLRRERLAGASTECFTVLSEALDALAPTVICATVNEESHAAVFAELHDYPRSLVLSEKPLASTYEDAERACEALTNHYFSMNMVERFSPIIKFCFEWLDTEGPFKVIRVESFWGKHRVRDPRPTMGVLTEIVHPLDLFRLLFVPGEVEAVDGIATSSDFSCHSTPLLDSVDVIFRSGDIPIVLHSSFVWARRLRMMTAFIRSARDEVFRMELEFDNPKWDCDRFEVTSIGKDGRLESVCRFSTDAAELPLNIRGVGKVVSFIESSVRAWRGERITWPPLADLSSALELQRDLDNVAHILRGPLETASYHARESV